MELAEIFETFYYDSLSKTSLRWNVDKFTGGHGKTHSVKKHSEAGCINTQGYGEVKHKGSSYKCHRLVYSLLHNETVNSSTQIDHLDGNRLNNSIENLRLSSAKENARNKKVRTDSVTGINGISITSNGQGNYYTRAIWTELDGTDKWKTFSHKIHGEDAATELAKEWRNENIERLQKAGAGYTERHLTSGENHT